MTISVDIIADSRATNSGIRLTTFQLRYPRFIHAEVMTHRQFSRNASSSRAIPVKRMIEAIREDPAIPMHWGKNQSGMQADGEWNSLVLVDDGSGPYHLSREDAWLNAMHDALQSSEAFDEAGYHKQIVNRLTEPFQHINVVMSTTEMSNFLALRAHPDAMPEMQELARQMQEAMDNSSPVNLEPGEWHLPYITDHELNILRISQEEFIKVSVSRCARVSYKTHEGKTPTLEADLQLYERLVGSHPIHASPAEHQATPDGLEITPSDIINTVGNCHLSTDISTWENPTKHGNFTGWVQHRKTLESECM